MNCVCVLPKYDLSRKDYQQISNTISFSFILPVKPTLVGYIHQSVIILGLTWKLKIVSPFIYKDYINKAQLTLLMQVGPMMMEQLS
jgi:hypothetical protein